MSQERVNTQFVMLHHTPMVEIGHHPDEFELDAGHIPCRHRHPDSAGVDLFDTLPTAKDQLNRATH